MKTIRGMCDMSLADAFGLNEDKFEKIIKKVKNDTDCKDCKWHDEFSWACCNGDSEHRADFVNCGCELKRKSD